MRIDTVVLASAHCNKRTRVFAGEINYALINATFAKY